MTATSKQLKKRWTEGAGFRIKESLQLHLLEAGGLGAHATRNIFALLDGLPFREEVANGRDLRGISLQGGAFSSLDLSFCDFRFSKLNINIIQCNLNRSLFEEATIEGIITNTLVETNFRKSKLRKCFLENIDGRQSCFDGANLVDASFRNANLQGASFEKANCKGALFTGANVIGTNFRETILDRAAFQDVTLDKTTDLRGASLINLFHEEHRNNFGKLIGNATDWRKAQYDETTRIGNDHSIECMEIIATLKEELQKSKATEDKELLDSLLMLERELPLENISRWYEDLLSRLPKEKHGWIEIQMAETIRKLR